MVGDLLDAMSGSHIPNYVTMVIQEVQNWLVSALSEDYAADAVSGETNASADVEYLFSQIEWANSYADVLPAKAAPRHEDALILSVGHMILDDGLRMLVDHAALFGRDICRSVWLITDTWVIGDMLSYTAHLKALRENGVRTHCMLVTPWNYVEVPWNKEIEERK
jgi:hypothetical protein